MDEAEVRARINPAEPDEEKSEQYKKVYEICTALGLALNDLVPEGQEKSLMMIHLEEVTVWANKGIARSSVR